MTKGKIRCIEESVARLLNQRRQPLFSLKQQEEIVRRFKAFRGRHNLSQEQLAVSMGVTRMTIWSIEKMRHEPSLRTMHKFKELEQRYRMATDIVNDKDFPPLDKRPMDRDGAQQIARELTRRQTNA